MVIGSPTVNAVLLLMHKPSGMEKIHSSDLIWKTFGTAKTETRQLAELTKAKRCILNQQLLHQTFNAKPK